MTVLVARAESRESFGLFALAYSILLISNSFQMAFLLKPFTVFASQLDEEKFRQRVGIYLVTQIVLSGALGLCVIAAGMWWLPAPAAGIFIALGFAIPWVHIRELLRRAELVRLSVGRVLAHDVFFVGMLAVGLLTLSGLDQLTAASAFALLCVSALLTTSAVLVQTHAFRSIPLSTVWKEVVRAWGFARWSGPVTFLDAVESRAYPFMAAAVVGLSGPAVLEAARLMLSPTNVLMFPVLNLLLPLAAQLYGSGDRVRFRRVASQAVVCVGAGVGLYVTVVFWAATPIVTLIYGGRYEDGGPVVRLLCIYYLLACVSVIASVCLEGMKKPRAVFFAQVATAGVGLGVGWAALRAWGITGAVVGMIAGATVGIAFKMPLLWRHLRDWSEPAARTTIMAPSA